MSPLHGDPVKIAAIAKQLDEAGEVLVRNSLRSQAMFQEMLHDGSWSDPAANACYNQLEQGREALKALQRRLQALANDARSAATKYKQAAQ